MAKVIPQTELQSNSKTENSPGIPKEKDQRRMLAKSAIGASRATSLIDSAINNTNRIDESLLKSDLLQV